MRADGGCCIARWSALQGSGVLSSARRADWGSSITRQFGQTKVPAQSARPAPMKPWTGVRFCASCSQRRACRHDHDRRTEVASLLWRSMWRSSRSSFQWQPCRARRTDLSPTRQLTSHSSCRGSCSCCNPVPAGVAAVAATSNHVNHHRRKRSDVTGSPYRLPGVLRCGNHRKWRLRCTRSCSTRSRWHRAQRCCQGCSRRRHRSRFRVGLAAARAWAQERERVSDRELAPALAPDGAADSAAALTAWAAAWYRRRF